MRLIPRKERPRSGVRLRITDADGRRITRLATNTTDRPIVALEFTHPPREWA